MPKNLQTPRTLRDAQFDTTRDPIWMPSEEAAERGHRWLPFIAAACIFVLAVISRCN